MQTTLIQRKSRTRTDIQWIISSVSLAVTLGLWGLLASGQKKGAGVAGEVQVVAPPDQVVVTQSQAQTLLPGQVLLFSGTAPQTSQTSQTTQTVVTSKRRNKGGGGGGATSTHSSHP